MLSREEEGLIGGSCSLGRNSRFQSEYHYGFRHDAQRHDIYPLCVLDRFLDDPKRLCRAQVIRLQFLFLLLVFVVNLVFSDEPRLYKETSFTFFDHRLFCWEVLDSK